MQLTGHVTSGKRDLSFWMERHNEAYRRITGALLVPGSLNVVLDQPWVVDVAAMRLEPPEMAIGMNIVPCTVEGIPAFVLRTDENNSGHGDHPTTVVEVAATVHLRTTLDLSDGDRVVIELAD